MAITCTQAQTIAQESEKNRLKLDMQAEALFTKLNKILNSKDEKTKKVVVRRK